MAAASRTLRILTALMARDISITLAYRGWVALLQLANLATPLVSLIIWRGAITQGATPPVDARYLTSWFVLISLVSMLTSSWTTWFLADSIRTGGLASWLVRPGSPHLQSIANNLGEKLIKVLFAIPAAALLAVMFGPDFQLPTQPARWLAFTAALVLALVMNLALDIATGSLAFWFDDVTGFITFLGLLSRVLSGAVVPLALFPDPLQPWLAYQPFRFQVAYPLEILTGTPDLAAGFATQTGWTLLTLLAATATWRRGLHRYEGAGA